MIRKRLTLRGKAHGHKHAPRRNGRGKLEATLKTLSQLEAADPQTGAVISLLKSWLEDDSGYDEETWPVLKESLNQERLRQGARRLFDA